MSKNILTITRTKRTEVFSALFILNLFCKRVFLIPLLFIRGSFEERTAWSSTRWMSLESSEKTPGHRVPRAKMPSGWKCKTLLPHQRHIFRVHLLELRQGAVQQWCAEASLRLEWSRQRGEYKTATAPNGIALTSVVFSQLHQPITMEEFKRESLDAVTAGSKWFQLNESTLNCPLF